MGKGFEDLQVWQNAKDLAVLIYKITSEGKIVKDFSLRDQMRRGIWNSGGYVTRNRAVPKRRRRAVIWRND